MEKLQSVSADKLNNRSVLLLLLPPPSLLRLSSASPPSLLRLSPASPPSLLHLSSVSLLPSDVLFHLPAKFPAAAFLTEDDFHSFHLRVKQLANACAHLSRLPVTDRWVAARCTRRNKRVNTTENIFGYGLKYCESLWVGSYMLIPSSLFLVNLSAISKS